MTQKPWDNIYLKSKDLKIDLDYHFELFPNGKYGFSFRGHDGNGKRSLMLSVYDKKSECVSDMAWYIKNQVLAALGQPEEGPGFLYQFRQKLRVVRGRLADFLARHRGE